MSNPIFLTISEAADKKGVTKQAIYVGIRQKRIKAIMLNKRWLINEEDLNKYYDTKYLRIFTKFNGEPLYDTEKEELSVDQAAKMLGCQRQHVYYAISRGYIKYFIKGHYKIIKKPDLIAYSQEFYKKRGVKKDDPRQISFA